MRELEHLLKDHDNTHAHSMISLEKILEAKGDLMMLKLHEIVSGSKRNNQPAPMDDSRQATDGSGARSCAGAQPISRKCFESNHKERLMAAPSMARWMNPAPLEADAASRARLPTMQQVRSVPDLTTVSQTRRCTLQYLKL